MRTTKEDTELVKDLIIEKSIEVFTYKGFHSTNMQDIADVAGMSKGPLYYHFKNKRELYNHVAKIYIDDELEKYRNIFNQSGSIFDKITTDLMRCTGGSIQKFISDAYIYPELEEAKNKYIDFLNEIYKIKISSIEFSIKNGEIKNKDAETVTKMIFVFYYGITQTMEEKMFEMTELEKKHLIDMFVDSLRN